MNNLDWISPQTKLPVEGQKVHAMDSGGHVQTLVYHVNMWWFEDMSMYIYYTPTYWKEI